MGAVGHHERDHHFRRVIEDCPLGDPPFHGIGGQAVRPEVGPPGLLHLLQNPRAQFGVGQPDEPRGPGMVRRRRRQGFAHRGLDDARLDRPAGEPAHRTPQQLGLPAAEVDRLGGAEPEQVVDPAAQQARGARPVIAQGQAPHHCHGHSGEFALDQIGRRGDLVGHSHLGHQQFVAVAVACSGIAVQDRQAG